jgi:hypothetical protein
MASKVKAMNGKWVKARGTLSDEWNNEVKRVGKYNFHITDCEEIVLIQEDWAVVRYVGNNTMISSELLLEHMCRDKVGSNNKWNDDDYVYCSCGADIPANLKTLIFLGN